MKCQANLAVSTKFRTLAKGFTSISHVFFVPGLLAFVVSLSAAEDSGALHFRQRIEPLLTKYCSDCHMDGMDKGGVAFDEFKSSDEILANHDLWFNVLKNVRSGLMPPGKK